MARAHSYVTKQKHLWGLWVAALVLACASQALPWHTTGAQTAAVPHEHTQQLAGYVSQEKRFLMYLFNGNAGKAQIA
ncbi:MAG TPA: hypothetical protein PK011_11060 [Marinagarivorans sp.]|nr:hypothetical protein [Cellvibrionaceae bacterium]HMY01524.1 hypothetical protein [Agitococcus sp.]HMY39854.1 hypothetical protein [Marinagarivorans sp.]